MPRYAVIGSNCFTGSHIVDALLEDPANEVHGLSRSPEPDGDRGRIFLPYRRHARDRFTFHQVDLVEEHEALRSLLGDLRPEVVIHVAALSEVALSNELPVPYFETNTTGVVRLCDHLRRADYLERYVHISSAEILGSCEGAIREDALFNPSTPYAVSKAAADMYLLTLIRNFDFPATLIRSTNVYGPHQQLYKIIPRAAIYLKSGRTIELHGGGGAMKSFIHIRDVVRGLRLAIERERSGVYHLSVPSDRTIRQVVELVCEKMGRDPAKHTRVVGERLGQDARYWLDCSKARRELGWEPIEDFEEGVGEVVDWVEAEWDRIREQNHDAPVSV